MDSTFDTLKSWPSDRLDEARTVKDIHGRSNERLTGHIDYWRKETVNEFQRKLESLKKSLTPYAEQLDPDFETAYFRNSVSLVKWEDFDPNPTGWNEYPNLNPFEKGWMLPTEEWPRKLANTGICAGHILDMAKTRYRDLAEKHFADAKRLNHNQQGTDSPFAISPKTNMTIPNDFDKAFSTAQAETKKKLGKVNIIVAGKTGVGKSTLINAIFGAEMAKTAVGKPVTQNVELYTTDESPIAIWDTKGLEAADFENTLKDVENLVLRQKDSTNINQHIHLAWVCINEGGHKVEQAEVILQKLLAKHMPVIGVITQARDGNGLTEVVREEFTDAKAVVPVVAKPFKNQGAEGLELLVETSYKFLDEGVRGAFAAAQKVDFELKRKEAEKIINWTAATAFGIGFIPIPFSDAALLVPVQITMLCKINAVFGLKFSKEDMANLLTVSLGPLIATLVGQTVVTALIKLVPGLGSVIAGTVAGGITKALGHAHVEAISDLASQRSMDTVSAQDLGEALAQKLKKAKVNIETGDVIYLR